MNSLAKDLAVGIDVRLQSFVFTIRDARTDASAAPAWDVVTDDGVEHRFDAVLLTCPVPQSWSLLAQSGLELPDSMFRGNYARTLAALVVLDRPSAMEPPGAVQFADDAEISADPTLSFVADNHVKGISGVPALTLHANATWSRDRWDDPNEAILDSMLIAASPWIGAAKVTHAELKRWRLATPLDPWPERCWVAADHHVVLAGDAFAGPKFEGAYVSGVAAADELGTVLAGGGA
jgi:predicted NAD/FAD-dependent oxidoreductase